ncbi:thiamine-phosphate kinase [Candidatus Thorarchaeota archaeon]|nr:MAG: thiamine-phosphate kinase [Candidatus Thorarchaeota archaeon]
MKTKELGERPFLKSISHMINQVPGTKLGFDDDASDFPIHEGKNLVLNVDTFVGDTDWLPNMTPAQVGRKTAVMTLSDLVAKGVQPQSTLLSMCVPEDYQTEDASEIIRGFSQYGLKHKIPFLGGDLGATNSVILTGVAFGFASPDDIITRRGATTGNIVAVTGKFGLTSIGFKILLEGLDVPDALQRRALQAVYKPSIPFGIVKALAEKGAVTSAMDSSDGLGITLNTMAELNGKGIVIDNLPIASGITEVAEENDLDIIELIMGGGEEFIVVLTVPSGKWETARTNARKLNIPLHAIGKITPEGPVEWNDGDRSHEIGFLGYDTFREWT